MAEEKLIGEVTHYFDHLGVAVFQMTAGLKVGDKIKIKGHTTDFEQTIEQIQVDHSSVEAIAKGAEAGVKVESVARVGDKIYLI
jgi:putative protease